MSKPESKNAVTIFSNGMADFVRVIEMKAGETAKVSIPVKKQDIGDVLASVNFYGPIRISKPLSYQPANEGDGNLKLDVDHVLVSLARQLSGADIEITLHADRVVSGQVVGLHEDEHGTGGQKLLVKHLILRNAEGIQRFRLSEIASFQFTDESVQSEIDKALRRKFEEIKPESTFIDCELESDSSCHAMMQYTIPAAAWKMAYRFREKNGQAEFQGLAIVDNNSDEDWRDIDLTVVTGEPITFSTDLAESKTPKRSHINIVNEEAIGAVSVAAAAAEEAYGSMPLMDCAPAAGGSKRLSKMRSLASRMADLESAEIDHVDVSTVGDFAVFNAPNLITINAKRSAVVPMFNRQLDDSRRVLYFRESQHVERAFRAIVFVNETGHNLSRGVCTVFEDGVFSGECIVPSLNTGEDTLLPHAQESGVRFRCRSGRRLKILEAISVAKGVRQETLRIRQTRTYEIRNLKDDEFTVLLDHDWELPNKPTLNAELDGNEIKPATDLKRGARYEFKLTAKQSAVLRVTEERLDASDYVIDKNLHWLIEHDDSKGELAENKEFKSCCKLLREIEEIDREVKRLEKEAKTLASRQDRLRKNLEVSGAEAEAAQWREELAAAEKRLKEIEDQELPELASKRETLERKLRLKVKALSVSWRKEAGPE